MRQRVTTVLLLFMGLVCVGLCAGFIQRMRQAEATTQCLNNLKQVSLSIYNYQDCYRRFPNATVTVGHMGDLPLKRRMSWEFAILAFLEALMDSEYGRKYHKALDLPWDAPENAL